MGVALSDYQEIFDRPGRKRGGDDGFALSDGDEAALDRAWAIVAAEDGVEQLADQPTEEEIRNS